jgi:hypothetical protein
VKSLAIHPSSQSSHGPDSPQLCEVAAEGYSIAGQIFDIRQENVRILLPTPLFAHLNSTPVVVTMLDQPWVRITGRVTRQQQIGVGEVLIQIELAKLPVTVPSMLPGYHDRFTSLPVDCASDAWLTKKRWTEWVPSWTDSSAGPFQDQRLIPRLAIHTTCSVFTKNLSRKGVTRDLSYTGFSVLFSDFSPEYLWNALFHIKFVKLKATPIGVDHQDSCTVVRFRVESIHEGENRWRDLHYSFWQHLS